MAAGIRHGRHVRLAVRACAAVVLYESRRLLPPPTRLAHSDFNNFFNPREFGSFISAFLIFRMRARLEISKSGEPRPRSYNVDYNIPKFKETKITRSDVGVARQYSRSCLVHPFSLIRRQRRQAISHFFLTTRPLNPACS